MLLQVLNQDTIFCILEFLPVVDVIKFTVCSRDTMVLYHTELCFELIYKQEQKRVKKQIFSYKDELKQLQKRNVIDEIKNSNEYYLRYILHQSSNDVFDLKSEINRLAGRLCEAEHKVSKISRLIHLKLNPDTIDILFGTQSSILGDDDSRKMSKSL